MELTSLHTFVDFLRGQQFCCGVQAPDSPANTALHFWIAAITAEFCIKLPPPE